MAACLIDARGSARVDRRADNYYRPLPLSVQRTLMRIDKRGNPIPIINTPRQFKEEATCVITFGVRRSYGSFLIKAMILDFFIL